MYMYVYTSVRKAIRATVFKVRNILIHFIAATIIGSGTLKLNSCFIKKMYSKTSDTSVFHSHRILIAILLVVCLIVDVH